MNRYEKRGLALVWSTRPRRATEGFTPYSVAMWRFVWLASGRMILILFRENMYA